MSNDNHEKTNAQGVHIPANDASGKPAEKSAFFKEWKKYNDYIFLTLQTCALEPWEKSFLLSIQKSLGKLSERQSTLLEKIIVKRWPCARQRFSLK